MNVSSVRLLPRPRVAAALAKAAAAYPLVVIDAPMGYGKTTAALELAAAVGERAFAFTVPAGPHQAPYLWDAALRDLAAQGLEAAPRLRAAGFPDDPARRRRVLDICRADTRPALVIFDDYHLADDPALDEFLTILTREQLPGFHLALFSRTRPRLPLEELRLKGLAATFGPDLLAFSRQETRAYFRLAGVSDRAAADQAHSFSEGWAAALWLIRQRLKTGGPAQPLSDLDTLISETVFTTYDAEERALLMRVSWLERFTTDEAARLADDPRAGRRLRDLHDKNAFLFHNAVTGDYQLHSIFRSFLGKALESSDIDRRALANRAGECLLARGELMPALRLFHQAGRDEDRRRLLEIFRRPGANLLLFFFPEEVKAAILNIPWKLRLERPLEYLSFIYYCLAEAGDATAVTLLEEAEERFARARDISSALKKRLAGEALLIKYMLAFNDLWAMRDIHLEAHRLLGGRSSIASKDMIWTFGCPHSAYLYQREPGRYRSAVELIEGNLHYFHELTGGCSMGAEPLFRAEWLLERGETGEVENLLSHARSRAEAKGQTTTLLNAAFTLARLRAAEGRADEAMAALEAWRPNIEAAGHVDLSNCLDLALGYLGAALGRDEAIPAWLREEEIEPSRNVAQMLGFIQAVRGRAALAAGDWPAADAIAKAIPAALGPYGNLFGHIHALALEASAAWRLRDPDQALTPLTAAVELARPDGIILTLAEYGEHILPLTRRLAAARPDDAHLAALARWAEHYAKLVHRSAAKNEGRRLTSREEEMLVLAARGASNGEIAARLGISPETVKKILRSAYGRLQAKNRAEAVRKFLERP